MKNGKRRWWLIAVIAVVVVAATVTATLLLLNRNKSATVHYLTSRATTGTIADSVQDDFTLADAQDAMTISLSGVSTSTSSSSSSSTSSGTTSTTSITSGTGSTFFTARAILTDRTVVADDTATPTPTPTATTTPTLTSFKPTSGPVGGTIILAGTDFSGATKVTFNNVAATFTVNSATKITATVPRGATSGKIAVTTLAGTATSVNSFKVTPKPTPTRSGRPSSRSTSLAGTGSTGGGSSTGSGSSLTSGSSSTSGSSTTSSAASGVVTHIALAAGATPHTLERLLTISGKPIFAYVSTTPLYKTLSTSLSSGTQKTNVATLQRALKAAGYFSGSVNGKFGTTTKTALKKWQSHQGVSKTGKITTSRFIWVPKGAAIESWSVGLGSRVGSSTALATIYYPRDLIAQAPVAQADISALKVGQKATLTINGATSDPFTATITSIASEPTSSSSSTTASSSNTVEYTVDLAPHGLPSLAKSGMTGTLVVTIAKRSNVLVVPTSAISGSSSSTFVRVMSSGKPVYRQVTTGMATSSLTQITSGLTAGEVVVTGQYTNSAKSSTSTSTSTGTGTGLGGGSFPGASGGFPGAGGGSGGFPAAGGGQ